MSQPDLMPAVRDAGALVKPAPNVADMLQAVVQQGITTENVAAFGELVKLYERMEERNAEKAFTAAFVALQADLPVIVASTPIPTRG